MRAYKPPPKATKLTLADRYEIEEKVPDYKNKNICLNCTKYCKKGWCKKMGKSAR